MKNVRSARWANPAYSYNYRRGIKKYRRFVPAVTYIIAVCLSMSAAAYFASTQTMKTPPKSSKVISQASAARKLAPVTAIATDPTQSIDYQDAQLQSILEQFAASHSSHNWAVQVRGLGGDERTAAIKASESYRTASIFKLLLMYPLMERVPFSQWGSITIDVNGSSRTLSSCVTAMLRVSDNPCGKAVGDYVGWEYADAQLASIGLTGTHLGDVNGPTTTAADMAYYLQGIASGKWFDGATQNFIIKTLDQQILRGGIPAGCGSSCAVADKTGDLSFVRNDAGIIRYPGGSYVLSIFSDGASYSDIAQLASQVQAFMAN